MTPTTSARLRDFVGQELYWTQPQVLRREFELKAGEALLGRLAFRSLFGSLATMECGEGRWTFKRIGFWRSHVTVRALDQDSDLAVFTNSTWTAGGTLHLADGRELRANSNFWMTSYQFTGAKDEPLLRFTRVGGLIHLSSSVLVTPAGAKLDELPWLVALGWYLVIKMRDDSSAGAAAAAAG